jgi:hypothetical protein
MLYAVFHAGAATNNVDWKSFEILSAHPAVEWAIHIAALRCLAPRRPTSSASAMANINL